MSEWKQNDSQKSPDPEKSGNQPKQPKQDDQPNRYPGNQPKKKQA